MRNKRLITGVKAWFTCTRAEKNAALLLSALLLLFQIGIWYRYYLNGPQPYKLDSRTIQATLHSRQNEGFHKQVNSKKEYSSGYRNKMETTIIPEVIDPNELDSAGFVAIGLTPKQACSAIRYRERIGGFRTSEDVAKVRVISPQLFKRWEPHIRIQRNVFQKAVPEWVIAKPVVQRPAPINLNSSDSIRLMDLPMIGSGRARAIVNYRERLGGFTSVEQLKEIRAIPDSVYLIIWDRVICDGIPYRKLEINRLPYDSLRHPYLPKQLARLIVNYREQHGPFRNEQELSQLPLADAEILRKLAPYISYNP
jgi:DNA uptake protein ComE-like DNA-binding protein